MDPEEHNRSDQPSTGGRQRTSTNESGLSFEAEPTDIEGSAKEGGGADSDPGSSSPSAAFTPGPAADAHSPFWTPVTVIVVVLVIALVVAAFWLL